MHIDSLVRRCTDIDVSVQKQLLNLYSFVQAYVNLDVFVQNYANIDVLVQKR